MNTLDLIIILIILLFMLLGSRRGFINSVVRLVEYFLSIFLAYKFSPILAKFMIDKWALNEKINSLVFAQVTKLAESFIANSSSYSEIEISGQNLENIEFALSNVQLPFIDVISEKIVQILAMIILFVILKILFRVFTYIFNTVATLPVLREFNKIGGLIVGCIEGIIVSCVILLVMNFVPNDALQKSLNESFIGNKVSQAVVNVTINALADNGFEVSGRLSNN